MTDILPSNTYHKVSQPLFPILYLLLTEGHVNEASIVIFQFGKRNHMRRHIAEIRFRILVVRGPQSLVVLRSPATNAFIRLCPLLILGHREEVDVLLSVFYLHFFSQGYQKVLSALTRTIGVTNSTKNSGRRSKEG